MDIIESERIVHSEQTDGHSRIAAYALEVVGYRRFLLTDEIGQQHDAEIADKAAAATGPITDARYADDLQYQRDGQTDEREIGAPFGLVRQFVPETEVEIDALEYIRENQTMVKSISNPTSKKVN